MSAVEGRDGASDEALPEIGRADVPPASASQSASQTEMCGTADAGACPSIPLCESDAGACDSTCPGCFINGTCVADAGANPENPCLICDATRNSLDWSTNDGGGCDDGLFCTIDDVCRAGLCHGAARVCEDGVACNGISTCDETAAKCTDDVNQCGANALCNVQTDSCVSTCTGCIVNGICLTVGTEASGNPCLVCDPTRSMTTFLGAAGKNCGAGPTACSGQDTCDAQGRCQLNHLPANSPCGSPNSSACDQPDTCDGNGNCQQHLAQNGMPCDDGAFCTTGDQCQGGQCVPTGNQNCGANRTCNEAANQCQCQGCQVGNNCFAAGASNPSNACQVCDPNRSATAFSMNTGASCGSGPTECSGQDTCNSQGQCVPNNLADGGRCTSAAGGTCRAGQCVGCTGCTIGGSCITAGSANPSNACQVCDPNRSTTAFSANANATCGTGLVCNAQAQCVAQLLPPGSTCVNSRDCSSGRCDIWFQDQDGDGHGNPNVSRGTCSSSTGAITIQGFVSNSDDCCDLGGSAAAAAAQIFRGQQGFFTVAQTVCPSVGPFDYNCSGAEETNLLEISLAQFTQSCNATFPNCNFDVGASQAVQGDACGGPHFPVNCGPNFSAGATSCFIGSAGIGDTKACH